jgi:hypothetical protein
MLPPIRIVRVFPCPTHSGGYPRGNGHPFRKGQAMDDSNRQHGNGQESAHTTPKTENTTGRQKEKPATLPTPDKLTSSAEKRQERIRKLEAKLQRERNRLNADSRKERNSQLFAWGAMVECVYKRGTDEQRRLLHEWADTFLTEERHQARAKFGYERVAAELAGMGC